MLVVYLHESNARLITLVKLFSGNFGGFRPDRPSEYYKTFHSETLTEIVAQLKKKLLLKEH